MTSENLLLNLLGLKNEEKIIEKFADELFFENYPDELLQRLSPVVETWPFMDTLAPGMWCCGCYLLFVLWLGPMIMEKRKPFSLHLVMQAYNITQVIFSCSLLFQYFGDPRRRNYVIKTIFNPEKQAVDVELEKEIAMYSYWYLISKYVELIDTVFFVLRKKQNQVTFLHVYHHTNMALSTWVFLKYVRSSHTVFLASVNLFVHSVMYSYYLLTALGSWIRPYLWWKKYITMLQLAQFVTVIFYVFHMALKSQVQKVFFWYTILNTCSFLFLFWDFYKRSYRHVGASKNNDKTD